MWSACYLFWKVWAPASSLTTFKLAWKTATLLALVTAKHCSDLTVLCVDNQHLFLQCNAAIFVSIVWWQDRLSRSSSPSDHIESHSNVNLLPCFLFEGLFKMY